MAANVGVSTMVSSFRLTFTGFLDQRLASEFYVYADDAEQAAALAAYLEPRVDKVLPIQSANQDVRGLATEVYGPTAHSTYRENWLFLQGAPDAWAVIEASQGAAINEQLARRADIAIGDEITLAGQAVPVLGIYSDYGNPVGQVLTLAVAGFAILMSLLTLATMRLPQLAPVWAQGITRARLGRIEIFRAVLLALLTAALALPLGLALAWTLLAVVNVEAFGWRLPMFLFPLDYLRLAVFAVIAAVIAALWPARKLGRTRPSDLLKVFSNER